jgi:hypothetical protein
LSIEADFILFGCWIDICSLVQNLMAAVIRFEHAVDPQSLELLIDSLNDWLDNQPELKRILQSGYGRCCCVTASST